MPVEFLSDDQVAAYERFVGELSRSELEGSAAAVRGPTPRYRYPTGRIRFGCQPGQLIVGRAEAVANGTKPQTVPIHCRRG